MTSIIDELRGLLIAHYERGVGMTKDQCLTILDAASRHLGIVATMTCIPQGDREELLSALDFCRHEDSERGHARADVLLLEYIGDSDVTAAFDAIEKWYG